MITLYNYGGGLNSTAMLVGALERGPKPFAVLFSDTGGEKPETYRYLEIFDRWLVSVGLPAIQVLKANRADPTLEAECLRKATLPSLAFGWKKCSLAWKAAPQDKWANANPVIKAEWAAGRKVQRALGFDADEERRVLRSEQKNDSDPKYRFVHPLWDWGWDRDKCTKAIEAAGLPIPPKSACFFCPATKKPEIVRLSDEHPELIERAIAMETAALPNLQTVQGLGRRFSWKQFLETKDPKYFPETEIACDCFDGDSE